MTIAIVLISSLEIQGSKNNIFTDTFLVMKTFNDTGFIHITGQFWITYLSVGEKQGDDVGEIYDSLDDSQMSEYENRDVDGDVGIR